MTEGDVPARTILREPLLHFLIAGLAIFGFSAWRGEAVDPASRTIMINAEQVENLTTRWAQTWQRPPTGAEIDGMIRDYIKEEVYYREAKRLGLDDDDAIIRRRLRSKMEFLAGAEIENAAPSDATLQAWLDKNPAKYAADARYSFDQIYLTANDADAARDRATTLLARLNKGDDWQEFGDSISLPPSLEDAAKANVAREFGDGFAASLAAQRIGGWAGPVASGFGLHLVRLRAVKTSDKPNLAQVRQTVENDWRAATLADREAKAYQALLDGYTIRIAKP